MLIKLKELTPNLYKIILIANTLNPNLKLRNRFVGQPRALLAGAGKAF